MGQNVPKENQMQQTSASVKINQIYHFSFISLAEIKTLCTIQHWWWNELSHTAGGNVNGTLLMDNLAILIKNLNIFHTFDIAIPRIEIYPKAVVSTLTIYQNHLWGFYMNYRFLGPTPWRLWFCLFGARSGNLGFENTHVNWTFFFFNFR